MSLDVYLPDQETEEAKNEERNKLSALVFKLNQEDILLKNQILDAREVMILERLDNKLGDQKDAITSIDI